MTNDAGQVNKIVTELINGDDIDTDGIDVEIDYQIPMDFGMISTGANAD